jgi:hypothetical protein
MKSFLDFAKEKENDELKRQVDHFKQLSDKNKESAENALMKGDRDGHALFMAKVNHFDTQHEFLKSKMNESVEQVDENHVAIAMGKEIDDEGSMIMNQLDQIERSIKMLRDTVKDPEMQIPAWVQSKVTLAADYMETVAGYMSSKNEKVSEEVDLDEASPAWQRKEGKSASGGLNRKGIASYRKQNPGSKLSMAVTTKPSKLKPGSKAANRRKSFCARMSGMKKRLTSAKTAKDPNSRINKSLRKWNC